MDRISEITFKTLGVKLIRLSLDLLREKQLIDIHRDIPEADLFAVLNSFISIEYPEETTSEQKAEITKPIYKPTKNRVKEAVEYCKANGIKVTVRNIAQYAGVSIATVSRYGYRRLW